MGRAQARDPWIVLAALFFGGMAFAVTAGLGLAPLEAAGIALGVAGLVYAGAGGLASRGTIRPGGRRGDPPLAPGRTALASGTPEAFEVPGDAAPWLERAAAAHQSVLAQTRVATDGQVLSLLDQAAGQIAEATGVLDRPCRAIAIIDRTTHDRTIGQLQAEVRQLHGRLGGLEPGRLRTEIEASHASAGEALEAHEHMLATRARLLAGLEASVRRMESAAAKASVLVISAAAGTDVGDALSADFTDLRTGLDDLRTELDAVEQVTQDLLEDLR